MIRTDSQTLLFPAGALELVEPEEDVNEGQSEQQRPPAEPSASPPSSLQAHADIRGDSSGTVSAFGSALDTLSASTDVRDNNGSGSLVGSMFSSDDISPGSQNLITRLEAGRPAVPGAGATPDFLSHSLSPRVVRACAQCHS